MVKVSVIVATYNHEKYIAKNLDSILCQKCDFEFEILVGDDASKDETGRIVERYAMEHPDIIRAVVRKKNLGALKNNVDLLKRSRGKYIAFLEGDDYWIDDHKLQKQVDFLDSNTSYAAIFGKNIVVDENGDRNEDAEIHIEFSRGGDYSSKEFEEYLLPGQTATSVYRRAAIKKLFAMLKQNRAVMPRVPVIDRFLVLGILAVGRIYVMDDRVAAYRYVMDKRSGSWSSKHICYSFINTVYLLYGLKEMERVGNLLGIGLSFDDKRKYEFQKVADYKGEMPAVSINLIRFFIWLWYRDKRDFWKFIKERHSK